jgi:hypothetical protein
MAGSIERRLITEKRGFRVKPIKHPRYKYVVYGIEDGSRVEQTYFQSEIEAGLVRRKMRESLTVAP